MNHNWADTLEATMTEPEIGSVGHILWMFASLPSYAARAALLILRGYQQRPLCFPARPAIGQTFPDPPRYDFPVWRWDGEKWSFADPAPPVPLIARWHDPDFVAGRFADRWINAAECDACHGTGWTFRDQTKTKCQLCQTPKRSTA